MTPALTDEQRASALESLPKWRHDLRRNALYRRLSFNTFGEALAAMVRIGIEADKADHHPEWTNVYGTVDIWLTTHDVSGISSRDVNLAVAIDGMFVAAIQA
jgi:4a-hydroxytetrahydrobiopterin dehydratase